MYINDCRVIYYECKLLTTWKPNFHQKLLEFLAYSSNKLSCVVRIIKFYLDKTLTLRKRDVHFFFISYLASVMPFIHLIWSYLLKKSLMENFIFCLVFTRNKLVTILCCNLICCFITRKTAARRVISIMLVLWLLT